MRCAPSLIAIAAAVCLAANLNAATVSYTGGTYTQNFDGLTSSGNVTVATRGPHDMNTTLNGIPAAPGPVTNTGVAGWTMSNHIGSGPDTEYRAQDGSGSGATGRGVVSFGTAGSGERSLGTLATSAQISRFGAAFTNNSGGTLNSILVSYTGEQWRRGDPNVHDTLAFSYGVTSVGTDNINTDPIFTNVAALSFNAPNVDNAVANTNIALNGNAAANQSAISGSLTGLNWTAGSTLFLRWTGGDLSGQDDGLAIDNVSVSVPEPVTAVLALFAVVGAMIVRRR